MSSDYVSWVKKDTDYPADEQQPPTSDFFITRDQLAHLLNGGRLYLSVHGEYVLPITLERELGHLRWRAVDSSNLAVVAHDQRANMLYIRFRTNRVYRYADVPETVFTELVNAPSVGEYFSKRVRDVYAGTEIK